MSDFGAFGGGHEQMASNHHLEGKRCPYCANQKVLKGFNDLETKDPEGVKEWDYDLNTMLPSEIMPSSNKKYWWKCDNGHSYLMTGNHHKEASCII